MAPTRTHTPTHQGSEQETICKPKQDLALLQPIMTYHDSALRYQKKFQFSHFLSELFAKFSHVPPRFSSNADPLTFAKLASLARCHP